MRLKKKSKVQLQVVYQKPALNIKMQINQSERIGKRYTIVRLIKRKLGFLCGY